MTLNNLALLIAVISLVSLILITSYFFKQLAHLKKELTDLIADNQHNLEKQILNLNLAQLEKTSSKRQRPLNRKKTVENKSSWTEHVTQLSDDMIANSGNLFMASKKIIECHLQIQNNQATTETHTLKGENMAAYSEDVDRLALNFSKLKVAFFNEDRQNRDILHVIGKLKHLIRKAYDAQLQSDLTTHQLIFTDYQQTIEEFTELSRKMINNEKKLTKNAF